MEEQEKKETLAKLYSLRAGLSVLSDENGHIQRVENDCRSKMTKFGNKYDFHNKKLGNAWKYIPIQNTDGMVQGARNLLDSEKREVRARIESINGNRDTHDRMNNEELKRANEEVEAAKSEKRGSRIMGPILMLIGIAIAIAILATTLPTWSTSDGGEKFGAIAAVFVFGGGPFVAGLAVVIRSQSSNKIENAESRRRAAEKRLESQTSSFQKEISLLQNELNLLNRIDLEALIPVIRTELGKYREEYFEEMDRIHTSTNMLYRLLQKEFSPLLDERDWQHLDLIIFYFETGRADSMKEALSMVDRELQTNRIVEAIDMAAREICSSIERQTEVLQRTMVACCAHLSEQLSSIETQLAVQNAQLSGLLDAAHMNNALLRHANDSSKQLYEDATRVCHLIEAREIRRIS